MATIKPETFKYEGITNTEGGYTDYCFTDHSRKAVRRIWSLAVPNPDNHGVDDRPYTILRRSDTDDGEFGDDIMVANRITKTLLKIIGAK